MKKLEYYIEEKDSQTIVGYLTQPSTADGVYKNEPFDIQEYEISNKRYNESCIHFLGDCYVEAYQNHYNSVTGARLFNQLLPDNTFDLLAYFSEVRSELLKFFIKKLLKCDFTLEQYRNNSLLFETYHKFFPKERIFINIEHHRRYALSGGLKLWIVDDAWNHMAELPPDWKGSPILLASIDTIHHKPLKLLLGKVLPEDQKDVQFMQLATIDITLAVHFWKDLTLIPSEEIPLCL